MSPSKVAQDVPGEGDVQSVPCRVVEQTLRVRDERAVAMRAAVD